MTTKTKKKSASSKANAKSSAVQCETITQPVMVLMPNKTRKQGRPRMPVVIPAEDNNVPVMKAAQMLKIHPNTVRRLAVKSLLPGQIVDKKWMFSRSILMAWKKDMGSKKFNVTMLRNNIVPNFSVAHMQVAST